VDAIKTGEFMLLRVVSTEMVGAFLDWGQPKDLFLPYAERTRDIRVGDQIIVFSYIDKSGRISASMRLERNKEQTLENLSEGQKVDLIIYDETDLGFKAIVNGQAIGMLYHNEIFQPLEYGQKIDGFIKKLREDNKIDLILQPAGHKAAVDNVAPKILELLSQNGGFYAINDKTDANKIYDLFGVSKNKYKIALGGLYKSQQIIVAKDGIRLVEKQTKVERRPNPNTKHSSQK
jgi:predicted RNA-binding protein (virulence factor B family)